MRYDVKKFLFVGVEEEKDAFFKRAQEAGIIHFIDTKPVKIKEISPEASRLAEAIKVLRGLPPTIQEESDEYEIADGLAQKILNLKYKIDSLYEEERVVRLEMSRVEIFGNFSIKDLEYIEHEAHRIVQFYCAKQGLAETDLPYNVIYVGSDHGLDYFVALNKERVQYPKMIEMQIGKPYGELKKRYNEIQKELHSNEHRLKGYAKYNTFLHHALIEKLNKINLEATEKYVEFPLEEGNLFVVQGWVPVNKIDQLYQFVAEMRVYVEEIAVDPKDAIPTSLQNKGAARIGEDIIQIYDTPSHTDRDPSLWILIFFALFFSMIIGDGGYGLILLIVALYIRHKHSNLSGVKKRVLDLFTILSFSIIVWGVLTTSFFGITIAPDNPIRKVSLMSWLVEKKAQYHMQRKDDVYEEWLKKYPQVKDAKTPEEFLTKASFVEKSGRINYDAFNKFSDNIMMELALFIGVFHLILSMGRYLDRNPQNLGWIIFLIGGYLYAPSFLKAASIVNFVFGVDRTVAAENGIYLIYGGIALAVIIAIFKHHLLGILEASVIIQIFADTLSYLRLYALGLSGSLLTATMNEFAASMPFVFAFLILFAGHLVNLALCIMGGVIHGLRLNFLEWYHYSFEGGGRIFNPLRKLKIE